MTDRELAAAVSAVEAAREAVLTGSDRRLLTQLADQLRTQAEREAPPALGALDRIDHFLSNVAERTDDETVTGHLSTAREHIHASLESLDDRGMRQHD